MLAQKRPFQLFGWHFLFACLVCLSPENRNAIASALSIAKPNKSGSSFVPNDVKHVELTIWRKWAKTKNGIIFRCWFGIRTLYSTNIAVDTPYHKLNWGKEKKQFVNPVREKTSVDIYFHCTSHQCTIFRKLPSHSPEWKGIKWFWMLLNFICVLSA